MQEKEEKQNEQVNMYFYVQDNVHFVNNYSMGIFFNKWSRHLHTYVPISGSQVSRSINSDKHGIHLLLAYSPTNMYTCSATTVDSSVTRIKIDEHFRYLNMHDYMHECLIYRHFIDC